MARSLLTEFYLENSHMFEYLMTGATDSNASILIRENFMWNLIANKLQVSCRIDNWLQMNYKIHVEFIIDCK